MTPEQFTAFLAALDTIDKRLKNMERDSADAAAAIEEMSKSMVKLQELYVGLDAKVDDTATMVANYVDATKDLRNESRNLHTLVRERLKAV